MWLLKLISGVFDLFTTVEIIKDIKENGWNWRVLFWITVFTVGICGSAFLMVNGFPVIGAIGFACVILLGFVLLIRYALRSGKDKK